jgi:hypothetical protein
MMMFQEHHHIFFLFSFIFPRRAEIESYSVALYCCTTGMVGLYVDHHVAASPHKQRIVVLDEGLSKEENSSGMGIHID